MILCWNESQSSAIHDHSDSHCFLKVLKGELMEVKYSFPTQHDHAKSNMEIGDIGVAYNSVENEEEEADQQMQETSRTPFYENQVAYINGKFSNKNKNK
jgi:cysteine dioxygenase